MIAGAVETGSGQRRHQVRSGAAVDAAAPGQDVELVKLLEQPTGRLVDGADDGPAALGQRLQQRDAGGARVTVQTAAGETDIQSDRCRGDRHTVRPLLDRGIH